LVWREKEGMGEWERGKRGEKAEEECVLYVCISGSTAKGLKQRREMSGY